MNEDLTALMRRAKDRHQVSGRQLAEIAQRAGHDIDRTQVNQLIAGTYRHRPSRQTVEAVSYLAGVQSAAVLERVGIPFQYGDFAEELPDDVNILSHGQRQAVLGVIRQMISDQKTEAMLLSGETKKVMEKYDYLGKDIADIEVQYDYDLAGRRGTVAKTRDEERQDVAGEESQDADPTA